MDRPSEAETSMSALGMLGRFQFCRTTPVVGVLSVMLPLGPSKLSVVGALTCATARLLIPLSAP